MIQKLKKRVVDKYRSYLNIYGPQRAKEEIVKWILSNEDVKDAGISPNGSTFWIILKNGIEVDINTK